MVSNAPEAESPDAAADDTTAESARIVAEICARLDELDTLRKGQSLRLVSHLARIAADTEQGYQLVIQLMHGNVAQFQQFKRVDPARGISRSLADWRLKRSIQLLAAYSPPLAACITQIRAMRVHRKDPPHTRTVAANGMVRTEGNSWTTG